MYLIISAVSLDKDKSLFTTLTPLITEKSQSMLLPRHRQESVGPITENYRLGPANIDGNINIFLRGPLSVTGP